METVAKLVTKAAELYAIAPGFFLALGTVALSIYGGSVAAAWWLRGYFVDGAEKLLKEQKILLEQRLQLAGDQATDMRRQITDLKESVEAKPTGPTAPATAAIAADIDRLLQANTAQTGTLTFGVDALSQRRIETLLPRRPERPQTE